MTETTRKVEERKPSHKPQTKSRAVAKKANGALELSATMTPTEMITHAIKEGAGVEVLEKLMALQERYEAGLARKAFNNAVADAKTEIKPIIRNQKVNYKNKDGSRTSYQHEDLAAIAEHVDPILGKYGLSYRFRSEQDASKLRVICILMHRDGHFEENPLESAPDTTGNKNAHQAIASAGTYLQRYTLRLSLGLAIARDDDGRGGEEKKDDSEFISPEQLAELIAYADKTGTDKGKFCEYYGFSSFKTIRASQFEEAKKRMDIGARKRAQIGGARKCQ